MSSVFFFECILLGLALAADASSVSLVYGARMQPFRWKQAALPSLAFGVAQGVMPALGWLGGKALSSWVAAVDHWIAFGILLVVGAKFIWDAFHEEEVKVDQILKPLPIFLAAFATSIDAFAVGFSLNLSGSPIVAPAVIIAVTTFFCSLVCHRLGAKIGEKFGPKLLIVGGIILILIGGKILCEHMHWLGL